MVGCRNFTRANLFVFQKFDKDPIEVDSDATNDEQLVTKTSERNLMLSVFERRSWINEITLSVSTLILSTQQVILQCLAVALTQNQQVWIIKLGLLDLLSEELKPTA